MKEKHKKKVLIFTDIRSKNKELDVIIPTYNSQKTIIRTLKSLDYTVIKNIIIIDDNSSDNTYEIIKSFFKNIKWKMVKKEKINAKKGVASSRNIGMNLASAKYVHFLDSDDWLENNMQKIMLKKIKETKSDIVFCGFKRISEKGKILWNYEESYSYFEGIKNGKDVVKDFLLSKIWLHTITTIYKKDLLIKNQISYPEEYKHGEDQFFEILALLNSEKVVSVSMTLANYYINQNSITRNVGIEIIDSVKIFWELKKYLDNIKQEDNKIIEILNIIENYKIPYLTVRAMIKLSPKNEEYYKALSFLYREELILKNISILDKTHKKRIVYFLYQLLKKHPKLFKLFFSLLISLFGEKIFYKYI
ncbi:glycosyl transferase [Marinitoga piezophila KA3]|uniref:Glycosyl transferase n=1 Tax=Marinitoga piezophila (strain DSM 14283 / JCM 11233 / KA3) TaxID=443254 RepID=H2J8E5_MARPK|nr:glycosyltransferase family 2 protein [Marinitoga piezophila]AEX85629.1 glycosyl transferase [Marinitoga piezophila KA3]